MTEEKVKTIGVVGQCSVCGRELRVIRTSIDAIGRPMAAYLTVHVDACPSCTPPPEETSFREFEARDIGGGYVELTNLENADFMVLLREDELRDLAGERNGKRFLRITTEWRSKC